jgi:(1->4)-alpha-D-glucan 1-alpha-D-glucosylmutase
VLSEIPDAWETAITRWMRLNAIIRQEAGPSPADELMLYQTLVAAWPLGLTAQDGAGLEAFTRRVAGWLEKAIREAKLVSEWAAPNEEYENAAKNFLIATLDPSRPVLGEIIGFAERLGAAGALNGLAQTLLRLTAPGVPDLYQGAEFWDQSLVDPDNRRPVDFAARQRVLRQGAPPVELLKTWQSGAVKQAVIARTLALRRELPVLFAQGGYAKLEAEGAMAPHILAFTRGEGERRIIVAVTRLAARFLDGAPLLPASAWSDTTLPLPEGPSGAAWTDIFSGVQVAGETVEAKTLFADFPVALLRSP